MCLCLFSSRSELRRRGQLGRVLRLQRYRERPELRRQRHHANRYDRAQQLRHGVVGVDNICCVHAQYGRGRQKCAANDRRWCGGQPHDDLQL